MILTKRLKIIIISGVVIIAFTEWFYSHSLLRPEQSIRASLLKQTPLGSEKAEVQAFAQKRGWLRADSPETRVTEYASGSGIEVTISSGTLGHYRIPFSTLVVANWKFDTSNHLVDITVGKASDSDD